MSKLKNLENIVTRILEKVQKTREDDFLLTLSAYCIINPQIKSMSFVDVMQQHKELGLPSFESVTRCRRKVQETRQDLIDWKQAVIRADEREKFENYSKNF